MVGLINLFLFILKCSMMHSTSTDVSMLDVAVGHFGHLEITSASELKYPFAREVAKIAYQTVKSRSEGGKSTRRATPAAASMALSEMAGNHNAFPDEVGSLPLTMAVAQATKINAQDISSSTLKCLCSIWRVLTFSDSSRCLLKET